MSLPAIKLDGVPGSGKTLLAGALQRALENQGWTVHVINTDCYIKGLDGYALRAAFSRINAIVATKIAKVLADDGKRIIIFDVCDARNYWGHKQSLSVVHWRVSFDPANVLGYLARSLKAVLDRDAPAPEDTFALNPVTASRDVCMQVHRKKALSFLPAAMQTPDVRRFFERPDLRMAESYAYPDLDEQVAEIVRLLE